MFTTIFTCAGSVCSLTEESSAGSGSDESLLRHTDTWTQDTTHCVSSKVQRLLGEWWVLRENHCFPGTCFLAAELSFCVSRGTCYFQEFDVWRVFEIITAVHFVHNYSEEQAFYCDPNCSSSAKTRPCASFQETRTCSCTWEHYVNS